MAHSYGPTCVFCQEQPVLLHGRGTTPPPVLAQFFYTSSLPIDDPLAAVSATSNEKLANGSPKPFSPYDNVALERAYRGLPKQDRDFHKESTPFIHLEEPSSLASPVKGSSSLQDLKTIGHVTNARLPGRASDDGEEDLKDLNPRSLDGHVEHPDSVGPITNHSLPEDVRRPFLRFHSDHRRQHNDSAYESDLISENDDGTGHDLEDGSRTSPQKITSVTVGVSRLHVVEMPSLIMKPIYWSQINDQHKVVRATWFFKHSMLPVPVETADRLELGYQEIMPYLPVYQNELDACIANGPTAELRIVHQLFPEDRDSSRPTTPQRPGTDGPSDAPAPQDIHQYRKWSTIFVNSMFYQAAITTSNGFLHTRQETNSL